VFAADRVLSLFFAEVGISNLRLSRRSGSKHPTFPAAAIQVERNPCRSLLEAKSPLPFSLPPLSIKVGRLPSSDIQRYFWPYVGSEVGRCAAPVGESISFWTSFLARGRRYDLMTPPLLYDSELGLTATYFFCSKRIVSYLG